MFDPDRFLAELKRLLDTFPPETLKSLRPASAEEVAHLEADLERPLPLAYKTFLLHIGGVSGRVFDFIGLAWDVVSRVDVVRAATQASLAAHGSELADHFMVLDMHLGAELHYFDLRAGDDPPVMYWEEGGGGLEDAEEKFAHLSQYILWAVTERSAIWAQIGK